MADGRVLVVEDDFDISNMLNIYFSGQGYEVDVAPRGSEALQKTRQNMPHLIFLDITMPELDGYQTCTLIRNAEDTRNTPVVMLSSSDGIFDIAVKAIRQAVEKGFRVTTNTTLFTHVDVSAGAVSPGRSGS